MSIEMRELVCPECGSGPRDVDPSYFGDRCRNFLFALVPASEAIQWTCTKGHRYITGYRQTMNGTTFDTMPVKARLDRVSSKGDDK